MILLIDNENFMIRYCKDTPLIHGFSTAYPGWRSLIRVLSDLGETVLVSGPVAEKYLDDNHIYYIHVEHVAKESFFKFERRVKRLIEENKEYLDANLSFGRLMFAVTEDGERSNSFHTDNLIEIWRLHEDNRYYIDVHMDADALKHKRVDQALKIEKVVAKELHFDTLDEVEELSFMVDGIINNTTHDNFYKLFSADTLRRALLNTLAICELVAE